MTPTSALDPRTGLLHLHLRGEPGRQGPDGLHLVCAGLRACAPNEALSDLLFAAYSFVRHSTKWRGEYDTLLVDAKPRVLHAVWTHVIDDRWPTARIFHASARLK